MSIFLNINGLIGTIASIGGLLFSWFAYKKIKEVKQILRKKVTVKKVISNIETIMKYPEKNPLSAERKRYIGYTIDTIEDLLDCTENDNDFEIARLNAIKSEINLPNVSLENIKQLLKDIKPFIQLRSEV